MAHGHKGGAQCQRMGAGFGPPDQNTRRLAAGGDAADGIVDGGHHLGRTGIAGAR